MVGGLLALQYLEDLGISLHLHYIRQKQHADHVYPDETVEELAGSAQPFVEAVVSVLVVAGIYIGSTGMYHAAKNVGTALGLTRDYKVTKLRI